MKLQTGGEENGQKGRQTESQRGRAICDKILNLNK